MRQKNFVYTFLLFDIFLQSVRIPVIGANIQLVQFSRNPDIKIGRRAIRSAKKITSESLLTTSLELSEANVGTATNVISDTPQ